jgi:hypothetical protein
MPRIVTAIAVGFLLMALWRFKIGALLLLILIPPWFYAAAGMMLVACAIAGLRNSRQRIASHLRSALSPWWDRAIARCRTSFRSSWRIKPL